MNSNIVNRLALRATVVLVVLALAGCSPASEPAASAPAEPASAAPPPPAAAAPDTTTDPSVDPCKHPSPPSYCSN